MTYIQHPDFGIVKVEPCPSENHSFNPLAFELEEDEVEAGAKTEKYVETVKGEDVAKTREVPQKAIKKVVKLVGDPWLYDEAKHWDNIRLKRNQLLEETDIMAIPDHPLHNSDLLVYRQALRDITSDFAKPDEVVWPHKPEGV